MTPIRLVLSMVLALAIPASAQVVPVQPVQPRQLVVPVIAVPQRSQPSSELSFDPALDPERARALIAKLRAEKRSLRDQMAVSLADLQQARTVIDEMTRAGGSLVRAQCVSETLSRNTAGAEENCAASGYTCGSVEGTCRRQCTSSLQCAGGFVCDIGAARCIVPPVSDD
jgi:hypothetical protein